MKFDHFRDFIRQNLNERSKQLHIHHYHNRYFPKHFEDILICYLQNPHIPNYQSRNLRLHIIVKFRKLQLQDFRITQCKLLMHFLDQKNHHTHFFFHLHQSLDPKFFMICRLEIFHFKIIYAICFNSNHYFQPTYSTQYQPLIVKTNQILLSQIYLIEHYYFNM